MHNFFLHKNILIFRRFFNSANRLNTIFSYTSCYLSISGYKVTANIRDKLTKSYKYIVISEKKRSFLVLYENKLYLCNIFEKR